MMDPRRIAAVALLAATLISKWEGLDLVAKPDQLAHGLPTVCYGMTPHDRPVKIGDRYTPEQCKKFLQQDIPKYWSPLQKCIKVPLTNHQWAAMISAGYNLGSGTVCRSSIVRRLNEGDPRACDSLRLYDRASGREIRGLTNRRNDEIKFCYTKD